MTVFISEKLEEDTADLAAFGIPHGVTSAQELNGEALSQLPCKRGEGF